MAWCRLPGAPMPNTNRRSPSPRISTNSLCVLIFLRSGLILLAVVIVVVVQVYDVRDAQLPTQNMTIIGGRGSNISILADCV